MYTAAAASNRYMTAYTNIGHSWRQIFVVTESFIYIAPFLIRLQGACASRIKDNTDGMQLKAKCRYQNQLNKNYNADRMRLKKQKHNANT